MNVIQNSETVCFSGPKAMRSTFQKWSSRRNVLCWWGQQQHHRWLTDTNTQRPLSLWLVPVWVSRVINHGKGFPALRRVVSPLAGSGGQVSCLLSSNNNPTNNRTFNIKTSTSRHQLTNCSSVLNKSSHVSSYNDTTSWYLLLRKFRIKKVENEFLYLQLPRPFPQRTSPSLIWVSRVGLADIIHLCKFWWR